MSIGAGNLLSGFAGALLVLLFGVIREWWRDERERRGLLVLLRAEIAHNAEVINTVRDRLNPEQAMEDLIGHPHFSTQKAGTWENVQGRAAVLLPGGLMAALDGYYCPLETLLTLVRFPNMISDSFDRRLREMIQEGRPEGSVAATRQPYREQLERLLAAEDRAQVEIRQYLDRPLWGPLFLWADRRMQHR